MMFLKEKTVKKCQESKDLKRPKLALSMKNKLRIFRVIYEI